MAKGSWGGSKIKDVVGGAPVRKMGRERLEKWEWIPGEGEEYRYKLCRREYVTAEGWERDRESIP